MRLSYPQDPKLTTRLQLALLLIAAMACVATMLAGFVNGHGIGSVDFDFRHTWLFLTVAVGALAAIAVIWRMGSMARREARAAKSESVHLRRNLAAADAIIRAEPQVLVFWEQGQAVRIVSHTLASVPGLPEHHAEILRFGQWLESTSAHSLKAALDKLFVNGRSFSIILKTIAGGIIEAEGRAAGGRAVLRLKEVSGYKLEIARIEDQHATLARDIRSSRALLNTLPMPVWLRGVDNRLIWVNAAYVQAVDAKSEIEVLEHQIELLEGRQRKSVSRALAAGQTYRSRIHLVSGGERKAHEVVVLPVDGMTAGAAVDVTDIESAQGELERQSSAYDRTLDRVETAVAIFSPDHKLAFYNAAFAKLWSLDTDWLASNPSDNVILDRLREIGVLEPVVNHRDWKAQVLACYQTGTPFDDTWNLTDGRILHVMAEQRPDGGVTFLFADETERLSLESRYNALIDVQRETLNSLKEGVAVFGTNGRLKLFNKAFCNIWHMQQKRLAELPHVGEVIAAAQTLHPNNDTWRRIGHAVTAFLDERETFSGQMTRDDGVVVDYALMPLPDGATLMTFADVTDAKRAERALVERNEALVAADRLKTNFIGHISYELRTPLNSIIGFSEMLASPLFGDLNAKQREYLADIMSSSKTLLAIINDILDLATIDAGAMQLKPTPVGVRALIDAAILGIRERAVRNRLTIEIAVADEVNEFVADEARMRQVLYNLLSNAVGFSKVNGTVRLACWSENGTIIFRVEDDGVGIPKDRIGRIFDRFESQSHGSDHRGAGLGLSIVKSLVELHGGTIEVFSEENRGTRVTVRLPEHPVTPAGDVPEWLAGGGRAA
ncbi:multi-sensor signal transduction histidine kinase [Hyphomicrobium denitrificans ATCC 51888]|uniref:histidine kinase n=1 Tax=Hyphomicrobium denitrificans (strain ATCC 51888 / DSM 1869 / NCIMB 11706 / TK 0415) TaxID=582899 RepID=D8JRB8_HYPDA|nr:PAS domain-containing sensor histidine kinase [Hyphomicrobium denitrificans]ADJ24103.1 multi-sensor signal transduction histidine kinase [Hyphomicrobium denitrificans ATCC 51888]